MAAPLSDEALNRATLARQGLLEPLEFGVADAVRAVGAIQAQQWGAVPVALASRLARFEPASLWSALEAGELVAGIGIRGTLHLVPAVDHADYAAVARAGGVGGAWGAWPVAEVDAAIAGAVLSAATPGPVAPAAIAAAAEAWVDANPRALDDAALEARRKVKWRPLARRPDLVRVPAGGAWSAKTPPSSAAATWAGEGWRDAQAALRACVLAHLRAFGPAGAEDAASWLGSSVGPVRSALADLTGDTAELEAADGRTLYDLPDAPRPGPDAETPPRFLAAFDSLLLAYAPGRRTRIMSPDMQAVVYRPGNLRIDPAFLVDGMVAGTWSLTVKRREARIGLRPAGRLTKRALSGLVAEGERLARSVAPEARAHGVVVES